MMEPGDLTESGLLYEGSDLEAWKKRVTSLYRAHECSKVTVLDFKQLHLTIEQARELIGTNQAVKAAVDEVVIKAEEAKEKRFRLRLNQRDLAMAKISAVQRAVQETPDKSVKDAWQVAQTARPQTYTTPVAQQARSSLNAAAQEYRQSPTTNLMEAVSEAGPRMKTERERRLQEQQIAQISFMCECISPAMRSRIPGTAKADLETFLSFLSALSKPFPLLELTSEVRGRIFGFVTEKDHEITHRLPPLLSVNKQIRQEARPVFFQRTHFACDLLPPLSQREPEDTLERSFKAIADWSHLIAQDSVKHLSEVEAYILCLNSAGTVCGMLLTFCFSIHSGLSYRTRWMSDLNDAMDKASLKILNKHVAHVESRRKTLHLQGESIIVALLDKPNLWR